MSSLQKKLAASVLKIGKSRVWLDPKRTKDIEKAITKIDIRKLIKQGVIKALPKKITVKKGLRKKRGEGSRKGSKFAKVTSKRRWIQTVRPLRRYLKELKASEEIDNPTFKKLYMLVKGGVFRSRTHMRIYMEQHGMLKKK